MSHLIEKMAYTGEKPWHNLGRELPSRQPLEVWAKEAGMDWNIQETPVRFASRDEEGDGSPLATFKDQKVLFRSDNREPLSVVSQRYQVVQPREVLEFYRDLTQISGYELETAGVLKAGRKFWALARTGKEMTIQGADVVRGYLLLATSCDGTLATMATPTTIRVVCNNTLAMALDGASQAVRVPHSTSFDAAAVKTRLGIAVSQWDEFMYRMKALSLRKVRSRDAQRFFARVLYGPATDRVDALTKPKGAIAVTVAPKERALRTLQALFDGHGRGAEMGASKGTAWGLLNAVTEYVDHERRARSTEYRLDSAWFGQGAAIKQRALDQALALIA